MTRILSGRIEASVVVGAILVALLFSAATKGMWLYNLPSLLALTAGVGIVAVGQALLMTTGEVDLSVGSVYGFAGATFILLMGLGTGVVLGAVLAIAIAAAIGVLNGFITTRFRVPSMIVTMGALFTFRGLNYLLTAGSSLSIPRPDRDSAVIALIGGRTAGLTAR